MIRAKGTSRATSVEEVEQRFLDEARELKEKLTREFEGRDDLKLRLGYEMALQACNYAYTVVTGETLPDELRLDGGEHFAPDGSKVRGRW